LLVRVSEPENFVWKCDAARKRQMRDLDVLTVNTHLHHLPTGICGTIRRINKGMALQQNSVEISCSHFQRRQIICLRKFRSVGSRYCERHANADENGEPHCIEPNEM